MNKKEKKFFKKLKALLKKNNASICDYKEGNMVISIDDKEFKFGYIIDADELDELPGEVKYAIRNRETGMLFEKNLESIKKAKEKIKCHEQEDKNDGNYTPNFYEIAKYTVDDYDRTVEPLKYY